MLSFAEYKGYTPPYARKICGKCVRSHFTFLFIHPEIRGPFRMCCFEFYRCLQCEAWQFEFQPFSPRVHIRNPLVLVETCQIESFLLGIQGHSIDTEVARAAIALLEALLLELPCLDFDSLATFGRIASMSSSQMLFVGTSTSACSVSARTVKHRTPHVLQKY
jgi:hypothetical protein